MGDIHLIDLLVFPDYCGGIFTGNAYIEPETGIKKHFNTFASEELVREWEKRTEEARSDPNRMVIHLLDANNTSGIDYLINFARSLDDKLKPSGRYIAVNGHTVESEDLRRRTQELGLVLAADVKVVGYGHHRGDCVPQQGRKAMISLGLNVTLFEELTDLSVGDMLLDRLDIVRKENPAVFFHYSDEYVDQLRTKKDFKSVGAIYSARKYLFVYCTAEQVREAAKQASGIEDFESKIGGTFRGFNFLDDYIALCRRFGQRPT
ncbi:hypothetical protein J4444_02100 [Candidatus Woesearchaeota archaeon]|nr:hypothetical protein [Candidatus Woesearchaeota archaeon]